MILLSLLSLLTLAAAEDLLDGAANATHRALHAYLQLRFGAISTALPPKGDPALDPCPVLNEWRAS